MARNDETVILENSNKELIAIAIEQLSEEDRKYLEAKAAEPQNTDSDGQSDAAMQTWTTRSGLKVRGAVVEYTSRDVVIQRRRGNVYVNDKKFDNLPGIYKQMVPRIVSHFEGIDEFKDNKEFFEWVKDQKGKPKTFTCDGVLLELENGDLYGVPFFFFSRADLKILEPGWNEWLAAADDAEMREQQALSLQAEAIANRRSEQANQERRQVAQLHLQLQGYQAGLFDLWEVGLFPVNGRGMPKKVVVPARNSAQAMAAAMAKFPGHRAGPAVRVQRKF